MTDSHYCTVATIISIAVSRLDLYRFPAGIPRFQAGDR